MTLTIVGWKATHASFAAIDRMVLKTDSQLILIMLSGDAAKLLGRVAVCAKIPEPVSVSASYNNHIRFEMQV